MPGNLTLYLLCQDKFFSNRNSNNIFVLNLQGNQNNIKMNDEYSVLIFPFENDCCTENKDFYEKMENISFRDVNEAYPYMERASWLYKITFSLLGLTFTLLGLLLKGFIFAFLCSPSEVASSINNMIFIQQVYRVTMAIYYFWFSLAYLFPFSLEDVFGGRFCPWFSAIGTFSIFGGVYWSSALAFSRSQFHPNNFSDNFFLSLRQSNNRQI